MSCAVCPHHIVDRYAENTPDCMAGQCAEEEDDMSGLIKRSAASTGMLNGSSRAARPYGNNTAAMAHRSSRARYIMARRFVRRGDDVSAAIRAVLAEIAAVLDAPIKTRMVIDGTGYNTVVRAIVWSE